MSSNANDRTSSRVKLQLPIKSVSTAAASNLSAGAPADSSANEETPLSSRSAPLILVDLDTSASTEATNEDSNFSSVQCRRHSNVADGNSTAPNPRSWSHSRWFDNSGQSTSHTNRQSSSLAIEGSRELVAHYDTRKSSTLQQHENFKDHKWGEDDFGCLDIDISDIDVSLIDSVKRKFPRTDSLAQCVQSYSDSIRRLASIRRPRQRQQQPETPLTCRSDITPSLSFSSPSSSPEPFPSNRRRSYQYASLPNSSPQFRSLDRPSPVDLSPAICLPKTFQEALEFPRMVSRSAGHALDLCPKRCSPNSPMKGGNSLSPPSVNQGIPCPKHFRETKQHEDVNSNSAPQLAVAAKASSNPTLQSDQHDPNCHPNSDSDAANEGSCGASDAFRVCPRRARRRRRNRNN